jgi:hypothetical protein
MAAYQNGNKLKTDMNSDGTYGKSFAMGYIVGTTEVLEDWGKVCVANGVTQGQLTDVVRKYFDDNPESLHKPAYMLVYFALRKVWPCKTESVPPENNQAPSAPPKPKQPRKQSEDSPF